MSIYWVFVYIAIGTIAAFYVGHRFGKHAGYLQGYDDGQLAAKTWYSYRREGTVPTGGGRECT